MIQIHLGTGLAKCQICKQKIAKDELSIHVTGNRFNEQFHSSCVNKEILEKGGMVK